MIDVLIIGAGPAGLCCALYASRAGLQTLILEKFFPGGQVITTPEIENYPGVAKTSGAELAMELERSARAFGAELKNETVTELSLSGDIKVAVTDKGRYEARTIVLASGASRRTLGVQGEERYSGRGISYCATCDGSLYKDKTVAVVGGGSTALEDALYLAKLCKGVHLIHRRDEFRGEAVLADAVRKQSGIEIHYDTVVTEITGNMKVESLSLQNKKTGETSAISIDGLFIAVGTVPENALMQGQVELDQSGYIKAGESCETSLPGVFVAGDLRTKQLRQVVTAVADGAVCATMAGHYIQAHSRAEA